MYCYEKKTCKKFLKQDINFFVILLTVSSKHHDTAKHSKNGKEHSTGDRYYFPERHNTVQYVVSIDSY